MTCFSCKERVKGGPCGGWLCGPCGVRYCELCAHRGYSWRVGPPKSPGLQEGGLGDILAGFGGMSLKEQPVEEAKVEL